MKYELTNGWTKKTVMAQIKKYNNNSLSLDEAGTCTYLTAEGNRCFIGAFIPGDSHKAFKESGLAVHALILKYPDLLDHTPFIDSVALGDFQLVHDRLVESDIGMDPYDAAQHFLDTKVK